MKRLSIMLVMVAVVGSIANSNAKHHHAVQQTSKQWTCTWEQSEGVELDEHGKQTTKSWKKMTGKRTIQASNKDEALAKFQKMTPINVETKNWMAHCTQQ